jgi:hypothetical protein
MNLKEALMSLFTASAGTVTAHTTSGTAKEAFGGN